MDQTKKQRMAERQKNFQAKYKMTIAKEEAEKVSLSSLIFVHI